VENFTQRRNGHETRTQYELRMLARSANLSVVTVWTRKSQRFWLLVEDVDVREENGGARTEGESPGASAPASVSKGAECLSVRQAQLLAALLTGRSTKEIGCDLGLSVHTVNSYKKALFKRMGVHSQLELCAKLRASVAAPRAMPAPVDSTAIDTRFWGY